MDTKMVPDLIGCHQYSWSCVGCKKAKKVPKKAIFQFWGYRGHFDPPFWATKGGDLLAPPNWWIFITGSAPDTTLGWDIVRRANFAKPSVSSHPDLFYQVPYRFLIEHIQMSQKIPHNHQSCTQVLRGHHFKKVQTLLNI